MPHTLSKAGLLLNFRLRTTPAMLHYFFQVMKAISMKNADLRNVKPRGPLEIYSVSEKLHLQI
jgi:hypothetical protein